MRYAFFGTPEFAAIILEKLIQAGMPPALLVCNPDRPFGRKKIITAPPVKSLILKHESWNIKLLQPETLDESFKLQVSSFKLDFAIVAAYAKILPKEIIELPRLGTVGVHPSLLPKYRGATPIQSVILSGEEETGTTLFMLDEKVDHGPILAKSEIRMSESETYESLHSKLAELSGNLLVETLPKFVKGEIKPQIQNEKEATYTKKFKAEDGYIDPDILRQAQDGTRPGKTIEIEREIRALNPEPGVYTIQNGKRVKLLEAELSDGKLKLKKIQVEGRKATLMLPEFYG